jgi:hypothetical protein
MWNCGKCVNVEMNSKKYYGQRSTANETGVNECMKLVKFKSCWALLKTRFRNSLSSLSENRERNLMDFQQTANSRQEL